MKLTSCRLRPVSYRMLFGLALGLALALGNGCTTTRNGYEQTEVDLGRNRLNEARDLYLQGEYQAAKRTLRPLIGKPYLQREVRTLFDEIQSKLDQPELQRSIESSHARAIDEVRQRQVLPETYRETRVIRPDHTPLKLPEGPMERMANRRVSIDLQQADIRSMVSALSNLDGLNFIADEALYEEGEGTLDISVTDVPLKEVLAYISRNMGVAFHFGENLIWVTAAEEEGPAGPDLETRIYQLHHGYVPNAEGGGGEGENVDALLDILEKFLEPVSPEGAVIEINRQHNLLVLKNSRENLRYAETFIENFDEVPKQVLIEARFITITQSDLKLLGTSIESFSYTKPDNADVTGSSVLPAFGAPTDASTVVNITGIIDEFSYTAMLNILESQTKAQTLTSPRVTVINDTTAELTRGEVFNYVRSFESEIDNSTDPPTTRFTVEEGDIEELQTGIEFNVRPSIGFDGQNITLNLNVSIEDLIEFQEFQLNDDTSLRLPHTSVNSLNTRVGVRSGQTVVLGGMLSNKLENSESKIPILGDLPLLGWLFKKKSKTADPSHLLIFLSATIIDTDGRFEVSPPRVGEPAQPGSGAAPLE